MGRPRRRECRGCNRDVDECGPLSARGLCDECGIGAVVANNTQMIARRGPYYDRWAAGVLNYAGPFVQRLAGDDSD